MYVLRNFLFHRQIIDVFTIINLTFNIIKILNQNNFVIIHQTKKNNNKVKLYSVNTTINFDFKF